MKTKKFFALLILGGGIATSLLLYGCIQEDSAVTSSKWNYDIYINDIRKTQFMESGFYAEFMRNTNLLNNYNPNKGYIVEGETEGSTRAYTDSKEWVLIESDDDPNKIIAFIADKTYGIEKGCQASIQQCGDIQKLTIFNLNNDALFNVEVNSNTSTAVITDVFQELGKTRAPNGCSIALNIAGIPWSYGFGLINPILGLAVQGVFFFNG